MSIIMFEMSLCSGRKDGEQSERREKDRRRKEISDHDDAEEEKGALR